MDGAIVTAVRAALDRVRQELETARALLEPDGAAPVQLAVRLATFEVRAAIAALDAPPQAALPSVATVAPQLAAPDPASLTVTLPPDPGPGGEPR